MGSNEKEITDEIMRLCSRRGPSKTICPSEVARSLRRGESAWRSLMPRVREVALRMAAKGSIVVKQKGQVVRGLGFEARPIRGPVRLAVVDDGAPPLSDSDAGRFLEGLYASSEAKPTAFQRRVHEKTIQIPRGRVSTYGALARSIGSAARPVGGALRRNKWAPTIPCHRVVASDLRLGGFCGTWEDSSPEVLRKRHALEAEGVRFDARTGKVLPECVHLFDAEKQSAGRAKRGRAQRGQGQGRAPRPKRRRS
jgi:methylated-DNA-[protein]-cysteine S-methyltransferase